MDEQLNHHLHTLPDFLRAELSGHMGNTAGLTPLQKVVRYRSSTEQLIAGKRAGLRQEHVDHAHSVPFLNTLRYTKEDLELSKRLRDMPGIRPTDLDSMAIDAKFFLESNRHLMEFNAGLGTVEAHLIEHERLWAQQQAQEAARQHAQRLAEQAAHQLAQQQAEEAAREQARLQTEHARQAALMLARQEVEEAARRLAQKRADEEKTLATSTLREPRTASPLDLVFGPYASTEITTAVSTLKNSIEQAIAVFSASVRLHADLADDSHLQALLKLDYVTH